MLTALKILAIIWAAPTCLALLLLFLAWLTKGEGPEIRTTGFTVPDHIPDWLLEENQ